VPNDNAAPKFNEKTLEAFLEGLLDELKHPQDAKLLEEVRRAFRKKVPFHMRSYASALMILRAAGIYRPKATRQAPQEQLQRQPAKREQFKSEQPRSEQLRSESPRNQQAQNEQSRSEPPGAEHTNKEMISLFVSMGKRHHLKPLELKKRIAERAGISPDSLGRVHLLENYSFIEVPASESQRIIAAMAGAELNGRAIEIKPAKKRSESVSEGQ
jgi:hypothetical protein